MFREWCKWHFIVLAATNPIPVKAAMNMMGMNVGGYRLPLYEMNKENKAILEKSLKEAGLI